MQQFQMNLMKFEFSKTLMDENPLRCTTHDKKRPPPYYNPFLPYILIPIKNIESKVVKIFKRSIFYTITIINSIIIIQKCVFTW
jgi:hypothetical protein